MSSGGDSTTTTVTQPWAAQQAPLAQGFAAAGNLLNNHIPQYYSGSTVADLSEYRQPFMNAAWNLGSQGTPYGAAVGRTGNDLLNNGASGMDGYRTLNRTANGAMLTDRNPYFKQAVNSAINAARPSIQGQFAAAGRTGSGAEANALADAGTRIAADLGYRDYSTERGYMQQAAGALPAMNMQAMGLGSGMSQFANNDAFQRLGMLGGVADFADRRNQALTDADVARFNHGQQAPWDYTQRYMGMVGGNQWGGSSQQTAPGGNQALQWASVLAALLK